MPAYSRRQQRWAFAAKGSAWARRHHFDNKKIPKRKRRKRR